VLSPLLGGGIPALATREEALKFIEDSALSKERGKEVIDHKTAARKPVSQSPSLTRCLNLLNR